MSRVVVITGGAQGIGLACCEKFSKLGDRVAIIDLQVTEPTREGAWVFATQADISDGKSVEAALAAVVAKLGTISVLVNNAARASQTFFQDITEEQWDRDLAVCLKGNFLTTKIVAPIMAANGGGAIVNISSINGSLFFGQEAYSAAKAGVESLTRSIAVRYGPKQVRCNAVAPGTIHTAVWDERIAKNPQTMQRLSEWYPLGRVGKPEDIASAVAFLSSSEAGWISGITLRVDGGLLAGNHPLANAVNF